MPKIDILTLRVSEPDQQARFFREVLGMQDLGDGCVGYSETQARLRFVRSETPYVPENTDLYWKISLSVPNIDLAYEQLRNAGVACSDPHQFEDVGYLAHFSDPEGFKIELIDHAFKGDREDTGLDHARLGGGAHLSLVSLRTAEIDDVEPTLLEWGMRPLAVQPLPAYGFTLYFYAFADDVPPDPELTSVLNRTWVYRRPYTVLEIQHVHDLREVHYPPPPAAGFHGLTFASQQVLPPFPRLKVSWTRETDFGR